MKYLFRFAIGLFAITLYPILYIGFGLSVLSVFLWHFSYARAKTFSKNNGLCHRFEVSQIHTGLVGSKHYFYKNVFHFMLNKITCEIVDRKTYIDKKNKKTK